MFGNFLMRWATRNRLAGRRPKAAARRACEAASVSIIAAQTINLTDSKGAFNDHDDFRLSGGHSQNR
ncbi:MAG: hypothetical protein ACRD9R_17265, partial [Pyrinomonadaceae bacterium]